MYIISICKCIYLLCRPEPVLKNINIATGVTPFGSLQGQELLYHIFFVYKKIIKQYKSYINKKNPHLKNTIN